jgi:serine/threonine-protein phosphatase 6 regulatory ankyrin repeat subunit B
MQNRDFDYIIKTLFLSVKEGDARTFARFLTLARLDLLDCANENNRSLLSCLREKNNQPLFDCCYELVVAVYQKDLFSIDTTKVDAQKRTILHWAALFCKPEKINQLILQGAAIDALTNGETALYLAAQDGHSDVVKVLLKNKANANIICTNNATPLFIAAQEGHSEVVKVLLENGANIDTLTNGVSALYIATQFGHHNIVKLLLEEGADPNTCHPKGAILLPVAVQQGHLKVVKVLLEKGVNINSVSVLCIAAQKGDREGDLSMVKVLLAKGANIDACNTNGATALHLAVQKGHIEVVKTLLEKRANPNAAINSKIPLINGTTPLHVATEAGHLNVVKILLEKGGNIHASINGITPLHIAAGRGYLDMVIALLEKGANIDAVYNNNITPLSLAEKNGHAEIVLAMKRQKARDYLTKTFPREGKYFNISFTVFTQQFCLNDSAQEEKEAVAQLKKTLFDNPTLHF